MKTPYFIEKIDWSDLRTQKTLLLETIDNKYVSPMHKEALEGILALIDAVQDYAVDEMDVPAMHVFDFEEEDINNCEEMISVNELLNFVNNEDNHTEGELGNSCIDVQTIINHFTKPTPMSEEKLFIMCAACKSDNVELKHWVNANTNEIGECTDDDEDTWCNDCETHSGVYAAKLKPESKVIGFQVVGEDNTTYEGDIHPDMNGSFCIYSLSQAREMLNDNKYIWRLLAVWEGDVEDPTFMFTGDPRD